MTTDMEAMIGLSVCFVGFVGTLILNDIGGVIILLPLMIYFGKRI